MYILPELMNDVYNVISFINLPYDTLYHITSGSESFE